MDILPQWSSDDGDLTVRGRPRSGASSAGNAESSYNRRMSETASGVSVAPYPRPAILGGMAIAIGGAILFSTKAVVAKLLYRYHIDAVTLIAFRMLFSFPVFAAVAVWKMRTEPPLAVRDRWRLAGLGLIGYYVSSYLDFLGLQYISVGLERLILFLTPTFVLLITALVFKRRIARIEWLALALSYCGIVLVFAHDLKGGETTGRTHDPSTRMRCRPAHPEVAQRRSVARPARYGPVEEELLEGELPLEDVAL